jgi:hypothetical protein
MHGNLAPLPLHAIKGNRLQPPLRWHISNYRVSHINVASETSFFATGNAILICLKGKQLNRNLTDRRKTPFHAVYVCTVLLRDPDGILYSGDSEFGILRNARGGRK